MSMIYKQNTGLFLFSLHVLIVFWRNENYRSTLDPGYHILVTTKPSSGAPELEG